MAAIRILPTRAARASSLLRTLQAHPPSCPCHSNPSAHSSPLSPFLSSRRTTVKPPSSSSQSHHHRRRAAHVAAQSSEPDYAFELAASSIRFGAGATAEVGMDAVNLGAKKVVVVTDGNCAKLDGMAEVLAALEREGVEARVFDEVRVEPKDVSIREAIDFAKPYQPDAFIAFGGGSVIDTAKLMNLYTCFPDAEFLDFVNAPLGKGLPITKPLKPLIAIPTTAGTGSETTGTAIFDLVSARAKTGIAHRALKPTLGICDPRNTRSMPAAVHASTGLDVLCHSLESWTAIPYTSRRPRPANPILRPAYQGANPISDIFSQQALKSCVQHLPRATRGDEESGAEMLLAATLAGVGFGNAGVHLPHGMSYPIASQNPAQYRHAGYAVQDDAPLIPHGVSVAVSAPAVFRFTGPSSPERHLQAAACFGVDVSNAKRESAGEILADALAKFLVDLGGQPRGLKDLGFGEEHLDALVEGTIPQQRVLVLAPGLETDAQREREQLRGLFEDAMEY